MMALYLVVLYVPRGFQTVPYEVLSGSMEPVFHVGSMVYVRKTEPSELQTGDVITFYLTEDTIVTHRILEKNAETQSFQTKGDANENADGGAVPYSAVIGKVVFQIPFLGYIYGYLSGGVGLMIVGGGLIFLIVLSLLLDARKSHVQDRGKGESGNEVVHAK